jgi:hypothetical protein
MKPLNVLLLLIVAAVVGGFVWFAVTDVPVEQTTVSENIPNERFLENT